MEITQIDIIYLPIENTEAPFKTSDSNSNVIRAISILILQNITTIPLMITISKRDNVYPRSKFTRTKTNNKL